VLPEGCQPIFAKSWPLSFRADRIVELIEKKAKISISDIKTIQTDSLLKSAQFLISKIKDFKFAAKEAKFVHDHLIKWDFKSDTGIAPFLFYRFSNYLAQHIFKDNIKDEKYRGLISVTWTHRVMDYPRGNIEEEEFLFWVDDVTTAEKEGFKEIVRRSLMDTYREYTERSKKENLEWQKLHTLSYSHPLGSVSLLKVFFNRGPYPMPGGKECILTASFRESGDFKISHLSAFRMIFDFSDFSNSLLINSSGQSGHFMSPYYDDQIESYISLKYRKMEDFSAGTKTLVLVPWGNKD
jgi:penicillin amidase